MNRIHFEYNCNQPESALQKWDGIDFCTLCKTQVLDLREKSSHEIQSIISSHGGTVCGRLFEDQVRNPGVTNGVHHTVAVASIAAMLTALPTNVAGQIADTVETVQVDSIGGEDVNPSAVPIRQSDTSCVEMDSNGNAVGSTKNSGREKEFMRIGRRHFYIGRKFPFITSRRYFMGRYRF